MNAAYLVRWRDGFPALDKLIARGLFAVDALLKGVRIFIAEQGIGRALTGPALFLNVDCGKRVFLRQSCRRSHEDNDA